MTLDLPDSFEFAGRPTPIRWEYADKQWVVGFHPYPDPKEGTGELLGFGPTPILAALNLLAGYHRLRDFRDDDLSRWPRPTTPVDPAACSVCGAPQFETPSGTTCQNGHGGAPATPVDALAGRLLTVCGLMYGNHTFTTWTSTEEAASALGDPTNPVHRKGLEIEVAFIHRQGERSLDLHSVRFEAPESFLARAREWFQLHSVGANNPEGASGG